MIPAQEAHWRDFYGKGHTKDPSPFAVFCAERIPKGSRILDLLCGNGRDTEYLSARGFVIGVDRFAPPNESGTGFVYCRDDVGTFLSSAFAAEREFDVIYARFALHAVPRPVAFRLVEWSREKLSVGGLFCAESREVGDTLPSEDHERWPIDGKRLRDHLASKGMTVEHFSIGRGLAAYKDEDPLINRIIARKDA